MFAKIDKVILCAFQAKITEKKNARYLVVSRISDVRMHNETCLLAAQIPNMGQNLYHYIHAFVRGISLGTVSLERMV